MKIFEVEITNVHEVLLRQTNITRSDQACSSKSINVINESVNPATVESVDASSVKTVKTAKKKPGRPKTTHRKEDEDLFTALRNNPEGNNVERKEWQVTKWNKFKLG